MSGLRVMKFLGLRAGWLVAGAWLLLVLTLVTAVTIGIGAGISAFYHPLHRSAPFQEMVASVLWTAVIGSAVAAVLSSLALALKWRVSAAMSVLTVWTALLAGSALAFALVRPGPEAFTRYVGEQRFLVPWTYAPEGEGRPTSGFSVRLCLSTLHGAYEEKCRGAQVHVGSRARGFPDSFDESYWRKHLREMESRGLQGGHEGYVYAQPDPRFGGNRTTLYFVRHDQDGRLVRLVRCYGPGGCRHHTLVDGYALSYDTSDIGLDHWEGTDRRLVDLVEGWRTDLTKDVRRSGDPEQ